jgi:hypothetical protein
VKELRILIAAKKRNKERDKSKGKASEEYYLDFKRKTNPVSSNMI